MFKESGYYYKVMIRRSRHTHYWANNFITKGVIETFTYRNSVVFPEGLLIPEDYVYDTRILPGGELLLLRNPANIIKFLGINVLTRSKILEFIPCTRS